jgi:Rap/ran-GAP protein
LDTRETATTGTHSVYTEWSGFEVMFHVSTLLPYNPRDTQQIERKRHLGTVVQYDTRIVAAALSSGTAGLSRHTQCDSDCYHHAMHAGMCVCLWGFSVCVIFWYYLRTVALVHPHCNTGNDICTIVFLEPGATTPFDPDIITSHFTHVFAVVTIDVDTMGTPMYKLAVCGLVNAV